MLDNFWKWIDIVHQMMVWVGGGANFNPLTVRSAKNGEKPSEEKCRKPTFGTKIMRVLVIWDSWITKKNNGTFSQDQSAESMSWKKKMVFWRTQNTTKWCFLGPGWSRKDLKISLSPKQDPPGGFQGQERTPKKDQNKTQVSFLGFTCYS